MLCNNANHFPADVYSYYIFFIILSISISGLVAGNFHMKLRHSARKNLTLRYKIILAPDNTKLFVPQALIYATINLRL